jgi:hypothetical protein
METPADQEYFEENRGGSEALPEEDPLVASIQKQVWTAFDEAKSLYDGEAKKGLYDCDDVADYEAHLDSAQPKARNKYLVCKFDDCGHPALLTLEFQKALDHLDRWLVHRRTFWLKQTDRPEVAAERRRRQVGTPKADGMPSAETKVAVPAVKASAATGSMELVPVSLSEVTAGAKRPDGDYRPTGQDDTQPLGSRGPVPVMDFHRAIARIVECHNPNWRTKPNWRPQQILLLISKDLDAATDVDVPSAWIDGRAAPLKGKAITTWVEGLAFDRLVKDTIKHSLAMVRKHG